MLKRYHHFVGGVLRLVDACVIGAIWLASYGFRFHLPFIEVTKGFPVFSTYASLLPLIMILWMVVFSASGLYQPRRLLRRTDEALLTLRAHVLALGIFIALTYLFSEYRYSRAVMLVFGIFGAVTLVYSRLGFRNALRALRKTGFRTKRVLAIGTEATLSGIDERFERFPELGARIIGVLTDERPAGSVMLQAKPVWGNAHDLPQVLRRGTVDEVLIALPRQSSAMLETLLGKIADETVDVRIVPDLHEYVTLGCEVESFDGIPIVHLNGSPLDGWGMVWKRTTDFLLSLIALVVFSPLLFLVAIAVKLTSRGPVFYKQERMGLDGRVFEMVKFRSMRTDAEADGKAGWTTPDDPRRTPIGPFLRSSSLDELPQFWNVLKGEMSLVGPRPERPEYVERFKGEIPHYMLRHKAKAGITGWAQVNGWRGDTSLHRRIEHDLYYIRNWSYVLDLKILVLTLWRMHRNAY